MASPSPLHAQYTLRQVRAAGYPPPLVQGRAPWWLSTAAKSRHHRMRKISFAEALKDFLQNVSFHCYNKLVEPNRSFHERFFWIFFHITMLSLLIVFLSKTYILKGRAISTTMHGSQYPITNVAFPTFSICSQNRMSNASATIYAEKLHMKDPQKRGANFFYNQLKKLRYFYTRKLGNDENLEDSIEFQSFLDAYDTTATDVFYNTRERLQMLTPACKDILVRCRLAGEDFDCLTEFKETLTANGFCCTFNADGVYAKPRPAKRSFCQETKGLVLLLNASNSDEFTRTSASAGFALYFYSHGSYADVSSGAVKERYLPAGVQAYISIVPTVMQTVNEARLMSPSVRRCYFADELPRIFGKKYSFNNCITQCRMHSILVLCDCVIFTHPVYLLNQPRGYVYCTLRHATCLDRYYFKWSNVISERSQIPELEREMEDSLYCPQCLPLCTWVRYAINENSLPLTMYNVNTFSEITESNMSNLTLTYVFFGTTKVQLFKREVEGSLAESLSFIGNILSIVTGFSVVGICEAVYFFGRQLFMKLKSEMMSDRKDGNKKSQETLLILP